MSQPGRLLSLFTSIRSSLSSSSSSFNGSTDADAEAEAEAEADAARKSYTGSPEVDRVIATLPDVDLVRLLKMVRDWNANARTSPVAQGVLHCVLRLKSAEEIVGVFERVSRVKGVFDVNADADAEGEGEDGQGQEGQGGGDQQVKSKAKKVENLPALNELLEGLIPYSQRHFTRVDKLVQDSYALDYIVGEMDGGVFGAEVLDV